MSLANSAIVDTNEYNRLCERIKELEIIEAKYYAAQDEIQHRLSLEKALAETSKLFMQSDKPDIQLILQLLGEAAAVNRVCLFEVRDDGKTVDKKYEWCDSNTAPKIDQLQNLDSSQFSWWLSQLEIRHAVIVSDINSLPSEAVNEKNFLIDQKSESLAFVPISRINGQLTGYLGFEDCYTNRLWHDEDIQLLTVAADLFAYSNERNQALKTLRENEASFRMIADTAPVFIYVFATDDQPLLYHNSTYKDVLGCTIDERAPIWQYIHPDSLELMKQRAQARLNNQEVPDHYEIKLKNVHGQTIWGDLCVNPIEYRGKSAIVGVISDITERKQMEEELRRTRDELELRVSERTTELQQANDMLQWQILERQRMQEELVKSSKLESLGTLAGGIAHDFNNILTVISGNISLAKMAFQLDDELAELLLEIEKAAIQARDLTQQLLTFSKGGAPIKETVSIRNLLLDTSRFVLRGSNVRCQDYLPYDLWPVSIDKGQISQVMNNLIINADQAMPEGGFIQLSATNLEVYDNTLPGLDAGKYIKITIKDQGIGIPPQHLNKIFDPYFTTKQKGHGLGLATVYSIIKKHKGDIKVTSQFGRGTTFDIYLPASEQGLMESNIAHDTIRPGHGRILIMDDEETVRITLARILKQLGYESISSTNGHQAINLYNQAFEAGQAFDLVIMDLTIPGGMGGKETIKKLRDIDPGVKAVVSSGYSNDPIMANYNNYGFAGVLPKPFLVENMYQVLNEIFSESTVSIEL